jgi:hypothetical protein
MSPSLAPIGSATCRYVVAPPDPDVGGNVKLTITSPLYSTSGISLVFSAFHILKGRGYGIKTSTSSDPS